MNEKAKEKAEELIDKFVFEIGTSKHIAKKCALIAVENEYTALREMLFNLRSVRVIENEKVYLHRLNELIEEEKEVRNHIELK